VFLKGDSCSGKSALTQVFHSDGAHYPKNYTLVSDAAENIFITYLILLLL